MLNKDRMQELEADLKRVENEFHMFYEITQAMRTTLNLDEILYIILTGMTADQGLGFNRAALFFIDHSARKIKGIMGIGPARPEEAEGIWHWIEGTKKSLFDLIEEYHRIKEEEAKPKFFKLVEGLEFALDKESGVIYDIFKQGKPMLISRKSLSDPDSDVLYSSFSFEEAVLVPLWAKSQIIAVLFADNFVTKKPIAQQDVNILNMFATQAALAIENSKLFEDAIIRSHTDSLTGLWNHGYFQYKLDEFMAYSLRFKNDLCLLMIDIDDFKSYNDSFGHPEGDKALVSIGAIIKNTCRREDLVCRYGGEEFVVILPQTSQSDTYVIAERIRNSVKSQKQTLKRKVTVSIGISSLLGNFSDKKAFISSVDTCLYKAKDQGKDRTVVYGLKS